MADVLIVDDEAPIREMLSVHVDMARYTFREAENGQDALNLLRERVSDVVVLDLMMPVMDGLETCRQIRANPRTAMAYVIMLTAKDSVDDRVAGLDMGADAYMTKPFEPDELMAQIRVGIRSFWERQSSLTDPLTNLFNGRTFTAFMEMEVSRSERAGTDLSLVFFEVDNLQSINEENGPAEGDRVLRQVGEILTANSRAGDVISHWGNERFAWLLLDLRVLARNRLRQDSMQKRSPGGGPGEHRAQ